MALTKLQAAVIEGVLGLTWQSPAKTSSFAAAIGNGYYLNTTTGSITVTMPSSPTVGDSIGIIDYAGTAASNTITLTSSNNIQGSSDDKIVNYTRGALRITYADTTQGWVASAAANEGTSALNPDPVTVEYLIVGGGGGGGGMYRGGGGGAGGLRTNYNVSVLSLLQGTAYNIIVGPGGAGVSISNGIPGTASQFSNIISAGGGFGSFYGANNAGVGGSGGGSAGYSGTPGTAGAASPTGQGNAGGVGASGPQCGGGGGGAGAVGNAGGSNSTAGAGNGGAGLENQITGATGVFYAGGGGGGNYGTGNITVGGSGIGGAGGTGTYNNGNNGTINTGSGGGGSSGGETPPNGFGGTGGSGIVILRYPTASVSSFSVTGTLNTPTPSIVGTDSVLIFTTGTGTITFS